MWRHITEQPPIKLYMTTGAPTRIITHILGNKGPRPIPIRIITIPIIANPAITNRHTTTTIITITLFNLFLKP